MRGIVLNLSPRRPFHSSSANKADQNGIDESAGQDILLSFLGRIFDLLLIPELLLAHIAIIVYSITQIIKGERVWVPQYR